ncbi:MAG TPA: dTDP-4-dehydrorhamnose 3,5-epimerase [Mycolicibacterium fallax]|nr:dTDP-4-dehydrorhamnose 3,5-epimerase [Mycolicibacterium fallax]
MAFRELAVPGAWELVPTVHDDDRGSFFEWFTDAEFTAMTGHRLDLAQANCSSSSAGVLRGLHFAQTPPGQAKYVGCLRGSVYDVVVDVRVGSPSYGHWDAVTLSAQRHNSVYLAEGLAHGFLALEDDATVVYLCSAGYSPGREHTISATDPAIGIRWPDTVFGAVHLQSDRDRDAPTLAQVAAAGLLPDLAQTRAYIEGLGR